MPMTMHREGGNVYRLEVQGTLRKLELERHQKVLIEDIGDAAARSGCCSCWMGSRGGRRTMTGTT